MSKDTKIVHFQVVAGEPHQIKALSQALSELKKKLDFDIEFLVSNDKIQLRDVKYLIKELYELYHQEKALVDKKTKK